MNEFKIILRIYIYQHYQSSIIITHRVLRTTYHHATKEIQCLCNTHKFEIFEEKKPTKSINTTNKFVMRLLNFYNLET